MKYDNDLLLDILAWDIVNWSTAIKYWEKNTTIDLSKCYSLEIGAGYNGGLSLWLSLKGSNVVCSGLNGVSDKAKVVHKKHNVSSLIEYQTLNVLTIPYHEKFDVITFKSVLGGIGRYDKYELQKQAIQQIYKALKPGGELFFAENLVSTRAHSFTRKKYRSGKYFWRYVTIDEISEIVSPFSDYKYITTGFLGAFGINQKLMNLIGKSRPDVF